ncbi:hypothetical protein HHK36_033143 [Tetracentron sinense]|uniref:NAC domain-containing protein n=1 Tax=Tetracentron sinense TaxID=13715 RepID=A0A835CWY4_TETSI|nr:hypothetical protein HHK36_033143 [Tetracentron sinense]
MCTICSETPMAISASSLFPGFRFAPTDEELISYFLKRKIEGLVKSIEVISEVDICKFEPWDLPGKSIVQSDREWFFFSPRGRKFPNGTQSRRATEIGYWKATGKERTIKSGSNLIGTKRTLVFHVGRAPKGERTDWIMHEYCMKEKCQDSFVICRLRKKNDLCVNSDTPNSDSVSQSGLSPLTDCIRGVPEDGGDMEQPPVPQDDGDMKQPQTGVADGSKEMGCCSKKWSNNYDSLFVEHTDFASTSVQKLTDEMCYPQPDSQINQKRVMKQPQLGVADRSKEMGCCSKKWNNSYDSLFVGDTDFASTSVQKPTNEMCSPQPEPEINQKDCDGEYDCFADILKDDIIKLDEYLRPSALLPFPVVANKSGSETKYKQPMHASMPRILPFQGTAKRRIRLRKLEPRQYCAETLEVGDQGYSVEEVIQKDAEQLPKCLKSVLSVSMLNNRLIFVLLLVMALLVLYLLVLRGLGNLKKLSIML